MRQIFFSSLLVLTTLSVDLLGADVPPAPAQFVVNPDSIRQQILVNNQSLYASYLSLKDAKDNVDQARGNLLPSLSISGTNLAAFVFGGPGFILSSVQFLLPFLMPANYFALDQAKETFYANIVAYRILELNTYSSALSLYYTIQTDVNLQKIYQEEADNLNQIEKVKEFQYQVSGTISPSDLSQAQVAADLAAIQASQYAGKVATEIASLRQALGINNVNTQLVLAPAPMPESPAESLDVATVAKQAMAAAPEVEQINYLLQAAEKGVYAKGLSFIGNSTLSARSGGSGSSVDTSSYALGQVLNIGIGIFPTVEIADRAVEETQQQLASLTQQQTSVIEGTLGNLKQVKFQGGLANQAVGDAQAYYQLVMQEYRNGEQPLLNVLLAHSQLTQSSIAQLQSQMNLNMLRVTLHRALVTAQFADIKGCTATPVEASGSFWDIFRTKPVANSLDSYCREGGVNAPTAN